MSSILQIFEDPSFYSGLVLVGIGIVLWKLTNRKQKHAPPNPDLVQNGERDLADANNIERLGASVALISILVGVLTIGMRLYELVSSP
ncbi:MAG: hypothetical protein AAF220_06555 [Pseudomonadota bacterium]